MSIYDYRTIIPAKVKAPDAPRAVPKPKMSMAEDAAICNAKMRRRFELHGGDARDARHEPNHERIRRANERDAALISQILAFVDQNGPQTYQSLASACGVSLDIIRRAFSSMHRAGIDTSKLRFGRPDREVRYRGKLYPSVTAAAQACGVSKAAVSHAMRRSA